MKKKAGKIFILNLISEEFLSALVLLLFLAFGFIFACYVWGTDSSYLSNTSPLDQRISNNTASFAAAFFENLRPSAVYAAAFFILGCFTFGFIIIPFVLSFKAMGVGIIICTIVDSVQSLADFQNLVYVLFELLALALLFVISLLCCRASKLLLDVCADSFASRTRLINAADCICFIVLLICAGVKTAFLLL